MLLKTFKGRILAVAVGMMIVSVVIFGYGVSNIYYHHMEKCMNRSLTFLTNIVLQEHDVTRWDEAMALKVKQNKQMQNILKGGLLHELRIEVLTEKPLSNEARLFHAVALKDGRYLSISSSTEKINDELVRMIASGWFYFLFGFIFSTGLIYLLIRLLFAPFNQLVEHCLTCSDPDKKPVEVKGGSEIRALRDAIASLQERISKLRNTQRDAMKALTHELKTPLAQLRLRIDIADMKGEWNADAVAQAREEIDTISDKITQILHVTEYSETLEKVHLKETIEKWIQELKPLWQHRELTFELDIPSDASAVLPKKAFERVARILIENALNHTCVGSTIYLRCDKGSFEIKNPVCAEKTAPLIHSTGMGLEIARTLSDYYGWSVEDEQTTEHYRVTFSLAH